jgi:hypothetical protein
VVSKAVVTTTSPTNTTSTSPTSTTIGADATNKTIAINLDKPTSDSPTLMLVVVIVLVLLVAVLVAVCFCKRKKEALSGTIRRQAFPHAATSNPTFERPASHSSFERPKINTTVGVFSVPMANDDGSGTSCNSATGGFVYLTVPSADDQSGAKLQMRAPNELQHEIFPPATLPSTQLTDPHTQRTGKSLQSRQNGGAAGTTAEMSFDTSSTPENVHGAECVNGIGSGSSAHPSNNSCVAVAPPSRLGFAAAASNNNYDVGAPLVRPHGAAAASNNNYDVGAPLVRPHGAASASNNVYDVGAPLVRPHIVADSVLYAVPDPHARDEYC